MTQEAYPRTGQELDELRKETTRSLDRILAALIQAIHALPLPVPPTTEATHMSFFRQLMAEVYRTDLLSHVPLQDAGWGTINRFCRYCREAHPSWASKDTFYSRLKTCLPYLLSERIVHRRPVKRRLGMGRARYEYRINPDHLDPMRPAISPICLDK
jgi:hypothetical protein